MEKHEHRFVSEEIRHICEDFCEHTCETCEFNFTQGYGTFTCGTYCPENRGRECPQWGISFDEFVKARVLYRLERKAGKNIY